MPKSIALPQPLRIAFVWDNTTIIGQRIQVAACQCAERIHHLVIRKFDALNAKFPLEVLRPLRDWKPHGILLNYGDVKKATSLRKLFPDIPMVSAVSLPDSLINSVVSGSSLERMQVCCNHFRANGVDTMALFSTGNPFAFQICRMNFHQVFPGGPVHHIMTSVEELMVEPKGETVRCVSEWLKQLPKPVGIYAPEGHSCGYLAKICRRLRLKIPQQVQLIGVDEVEGCLQCDPPLTSITPPMEEIGEKAMETLLRWIRKETPPPPPRIPVDGSALVIRGSTCSLSLEAEVISKTINRLHSDALRGMKAKELVNRSNVGSYTFYKAFRSATRATPARMLRETRLKEACRLLQQSNLSIESIVKKCGFSSANYFAQIFRREIGKSPTQYRNEKSKIA